MPNDNGDKKTFAVPNNKGEPPLFLGLMYAATRSEEGFEDPQKGPGTPLHSAYIFPYVPSEEEKKKADSDGAELPLFVSYIFPYWNADSVVLGGGGEGGHAALGGRGNQIMFLGEVYAFKPGNAETD